MATTNNSVTILSSATSTAASAWAGMAYAGGGGLSTDTVFHITGYDFRDLFRQSYDGGTGEKQGDLQQVNKRVLLVLKTDVQSGDDIVPIYTSTFKKIYRDATDPTKVYRCGGAVYEAWRAVSGVGLTNEGYLKKLLEVTKDKDGNQRPLKASYTYHRVLARDGSAYEKELLSIDFAD